MKKRPLFIVIVKHYILVVHDILDVESMIFLTATSATATTFNVFYATSLATSLEYSSVTLVGTVTTSGAFNTLVTGNILNG